MILVGFVVDGKKSHFEAIYCHGLGKIMVDGRTTRGRYHFFDFMCYDTKQVCQFVGTLSVE
jgi:hypothetical protein